MGTRIEAVLFDWGGVLIENPAPGLMDYCARALGVAVEDYVRVHNAHGEAFQKGLMPEEVFWRRICGDLHCLFPRHKSLWGDAFRAVCRLREEVFALVRQLRKRGYKTGLLSNTDDFEGLPSNYQLARDFAGSHLELGITRAIGSIEGMLRLANAGDTLVDGGSAAVALLGSGSVAFGVPRPCRRRGDIPARGHACATRMAVSSSHGYLSESCFLAQIL